MDATLDRAAVESDSGDDDDSHRILHTTDAFSSQANPAFVEHVSKGSQLKKRAKEILHINHPRTTVNAARKTNREVAANVSTPEVSHAYDVELVLAQENMESAKTEEERSSAHGDLEVLKRARQDMFVRWTMDRHVLKIRQLEKKPFLPKARTDFMMKDESGQHKMDWKAYGSHVRRL